MNEVNQSTKSVWERNYDGKSEDESYHLGLYWAARSNQNGNKAGNISYLSDIYPSLIDI